MLDRFNVRTKGPEGDREPGATGPAQPREHSNVLAPLAVVSIIVLLTVFVLALIFGESDESDSLRGIGQLLRLIGQLLRALS